MDTFTLTFQRQLSNKVSMEIGYIGRLINNEYLPINLNAVPYMMTKGGQTFAKAYANTVIGVLRQRKSQEHGRRELRSAMRLQSLRSRSSRPRWRVLATATASPTAPRPLSPTRATMARAISPSQNVWSLYSDLDNGGFNFPRSMMNTPLNCPTGSEIGCQRQLTSGVGMNASIGYGNYNALFVTLKSQDWHGVTMQSNFTWSKALGTGAVVQATSGATPPDPFNLGTGYGYAAVRSHACLQPVRRLSASLVQVAVRLDGTPAGRLDDRSGLHRRQRPADHPWHDQWRRPGFWRRRLRQLLRIRISENAIPITPIQRDTVHVISSSGNGIGTAGLGGANLFADPAAVYNNVRQPILGYDTKDGGFGVTARHALLERGFEREEDVQDHRAFQHSSSRSSSPTSLTTTSSAIPFGDYLDTSNPDGFGSLPGSVSNRQLDLSTADGVWYTSQFLEISAFPGLVYPVEEPVRRDIDGSLRG